MIISLTPNANEEQVEQVRLVLQKVGYSCSDVMTQKGRYLIAIGQQEIDIRTIGQLPGVRDVHRVSDAFKLVSRKWKVTPTVIDLGDGVLIAEGKLTLMAGPCSIESEPQIRSVAEHLSGIGVRIMRGGAFKPRTSPYSFRGLGIAGLKMARRIADQYRLKIISEVLEISQIEEMYDYVDIYQVGTRNSQNFSLLHELGQVDKPVLVKRGMSGTVEELLQAAEYVFANGNEEIILCERGIRTFEKAYRNTLDLNAVPYLKEKSHLPVVVDPSHGVGVRRYVESMALAAVVAGADGLLYEAHAQPDEAASDGQQTLDFVQSARVVARSQRVFEMRAGNYV